VRVDFPYVGVPPLDVPDARLMAVVGPADRAPAHSAESTIRHALANPIGCPHLKQLVAAASKSPRVLILIDDNTRPTPAALIVPWVLREIQTGRVDAEIGFMVASGTHRPMTSGEKLAKLGADVVGVYPVLDHRWDRPSELVNLGETPSGIPVEVNRLLLSADLVIGIGHVAPHRMCGFGGGSKIVQPGVCGPATTGRTHWAAAAYPGAELLGIVENPVRAEMDRVAEMAGLRAVFNVVLNTRDELVGAFFGAPVPAHRAAAALAGEVFRGKLPALADVVVIESYPGDLDMWQASKALAAAELAVKPGGVVVLVTPCPEGVSSEHPGVLQFGYRPPAEVEDWVRRGKLADLMVAAELAIGGRVIRDRARGILVSPCIPPSDARRLGFEPAASPQDALDLALHLTGPDATVLVLRHGGEILPVIEAAKS
jgi:lactate racemase